MTAANPKAQQDNVFDAPVATILILLLVAIGGADLLIDGSLSRDYRVFLDTIAVPVAGLALGRGWAARKAG